MCRLLGYQGPPLQLDRLLLKPERSLVVQAYNPREMRSALLNADGFGIGWYHPHQDADPYTYRSTAPIWHDLNLPQLARYVESGCILGYVRSATPGLAVDFSNCQPFSSQGLPLPHRLLFTHNGFIETFRTTLYRPIRNLLSDAIYQHVQGATDSEHLFALLLEVLHANPQLSLVQALENTLSKLQAIASDTYFCANILVSDGRQLVASRFASKPPAPSLYWLLDDPAFPGAAIVASEPMFDGNWQPCPEASLIHVGADLNVRVRSLW